MKVIRVSSRGRITILQALLTAQHWEAGQKLVAIVAGDGILLNPKKPFLETTLDQVAVSLKYQGDSKSLDDLEDAIYRGVMEKEEYGR